MAKKPVTTPTGVAVWPWIQNPDYKFNKDGEYKVKLRLPAEKAAPFITEINAQVKKIYEEEVAARAEASKTRKPGEKKLKPVKMCDNLPVAELEGGDVELSFKLNATGTDPKTQKKFTQKPVIFDHLGKPWPEEVRIGGGSLIKIAFEYNPFCNDLLGAGCSLRLKAVQIIEHKEFGADAEYYGFEVEAEDAPETATDDDEATPEAGETASGDSDF